MKIKAILLSMLFASPSIAQQSCASIFDEAQCNRISSCTWNALGAGPDNPGRCMVAFRALVLSTKSGDILRITLSDPTKLADVIQQLSAAKTIAAPQPNSQITVDLKGFSENDMKEIQKKVNDTPRH